jgi:hypothetical protein
MRRVLLPILVIGILLLNACGAPSTAPSTEAPSTPPKQEVELNVGEHATVTYQQIIDTITAAITEDLEVEDYDYRLRKVEIEDAKINVYFDCHSGVSSGDWIINEGRLWVRFVAGTGIRDENYDLVGNIYSTGYDIYVYMWTWWDEDEITPWGQAIIRNSGKPFTTGDLDRWEWIDGPGMKMFE